MFPLRTSGERAVELTGERTLPGLDHENYWFRRHEVAYQFLLPHCAGMRVLEAGCGEGYGADMIAAVARQVVALDYDAATVQHVASAYPRVPLARANLAALPLRAAGFDVVASLQVIEHMWDQPGFLLECARVLRPGGLLALTTPNRLTFSPGGTVNPFHTRELTAAELADLLDAAGFTVTDMLGVRAGRWLRELAARHGGSLVEAQLAAPPDRWSEELRRDVASVRAADFVVTGADPATCLDLLALARVVG